MIRIIIYSSKIFFIFLLLSGCLHVPSGQLRIDFGLEYNQNNMHTILLGGDDGCGRIRTNIDIEGIEKSVESFDFYGINIITISTYYKFENMIKPYMQFDFIQSIMPKYFDDHILIIVITSTTGGTFFKNTRLVNYNGKLQLRAGIR